VDLDWNAVSASAAEMEMRVQLLVGLETSTDTPWACWYFWRHELHIAGSRFAIFYGLRRFNKGKEQPFGALIGVLNGILQMPRR
jgi:hypothetical protein